jgi:CDP-diacylglycerol--serine O-phosphatidyltransferase
MTFLDSTEATPKVPDIEHAPLPLPDKRRRGIYILPNLFTTAALFAGFYAIVQAMNQRFEYAAVAIFVAMVLDGLDGRIARMTNTQSEFGAEYDSLSDMVSFGAAPALVMYEWALQDLGKLGWVAAFIYCAGAQPGRGGAGGRHGVGGHRQRLRRQRPALVRCRTDHLRRRIDGQ